jgi:hypothetical protein
MLIERQYNMRFKMNILNPKVDLYFAEGWLLVHHADNIPFPIFY